MNSASPEEQQLVAFVMLGTAAVAAGTAGYFALRTRKRIAASVATQGTVVGSARRSSKTHAVVVEFADESGQTRRFTSRAAASGWDRRQGESIGVLYRRDDPSDARLGEWFVQWWQAATAALCAVGVLLGGIVLLTLTGG